MKNKYNFLFGDSPDKRNFVDDWRSHDFKIGNLVEIGEDCYFIASKEQYILTADGGQHLQKTYEAVNLSTGYIHAETETMDDLGIVLADKLANNFGDMPPIRGIYKNICHFCDQF